MKRVCAECGERGRESDPLIRVRRHTRQEVWKHFGCAGEAERTAFLRPGKLVSVKREDGEDA